MVDIFCRKPPKKIRLKPEDNLLKRASDPNLYKNQNKIKKWKQLIKIMAHKLYSDLQRCAARNYLIQRTGRKDLFSETI
ncbi:protein of unknown function [Chryseobacterium sp. JV274]|nr:protein of unknown function [Chryseobacterium sp. JV274]